MIKTRGQRDRAQVTFTLDSRVDAQSAAVCGEFNGWSGLEMERAGDGSFSATLELEVGRRYRFRYLLDGTRWENDWAADEYVPNDFGGDDSVVDLTVLTEPVPSASKSAPTPKKASAKPTASKAAPAKAAPARAAAAKKAPAAEATATKAPAKKAPAKKQP